MIKIVIIDDEPKERNVLENIIKSYYPEAQIVGMGENVTTGIQVIQEKKPDVVLLDINMPDGTGFDLLDQIPEIDFQLIFVTAHEEFALKAIKLSAIDYILKPIDPNEIVEALKKASKFDESLIEESRLKKEVVSNNLDEKIKNKKVVLKTQDSLLVVSLDDVIRCESDGNYTRFYFTNRIPLIISRTLKDFNDILLFYRFQRVHRSHLINVDHISSYVKKDGGYIVMSDNSIIPVSIRKKEELLNVFKEL